MSTENLIFYSLIVLGVWSVVIGVLYITMHALAKRKLRKYFKQDD